MHLQATNLARPGSAIPRTDSCRRYTCSPRQQQRHRHQPPNGQLGAPTLPFAPFIGSLARIATAAASDPLDAAADAPETAREAIELGNSFAKEARWSEALAVYEKALTLPGTGLKRYRDKPRLISDGEKSAALFNIACCHAQLGDVRAGLVALAGCLELGYDDFAQLRSDPDLEPLRKDERFEGLLRRFERPSNPMGAFLGGLFGKK